MSDDPLHYQQAIQRVVRDALSYVGENGLPGEHHFYLSFLSQAPGVDIPQFLVDQFPEEVSIVFQHVFWDLEVEDELFSVSLSFNAVKYRLIVPFAAVTAFTDPHAKFALRMEPSFEEEKPGPRGTWHQKRPAETPAIKTPAIKTPATETPTIEATATEATATEAPAVEASPAKAPAAKAGSGDDDEVEAEEKPPREAEIVDFKSFRKRP